MSSNSLYRAAAVALIMSAVLTLPGFAIHPPVEPGDMTTTVWRVSHLVLWLGGALSLVGVAGLFLRHRAEVRLVGASGAALATIGLLALTGAYYSEAFIAPVLGSEVPELMETFPGGGDWIAYRMTVAISSVATGLGVVLLGVGLLRTRLPRWPIAAASVGALGAGIQFILPRPVSLTVITILAVGLGGLGYGLWTAARRPLPA